MEKVSSFGQFLPVRAGDEEARRGSGAQLPPRPWRLSGIEREIKPAGGQQGSREDWVQQQEEEALVALRGSFSFAAL
jgi:hypothetical protein